ncbi:MAG: RNA-binding protein [Candidatus Cloacimonetes bacterium]|nr:RNA-binding protein [Candidatus Cloacimonadota bacterium]
MNIYVGNVSYDLTEKGLEELFAEFGSVTAARIITDRMTGRSKGFGFVEMEKKEEGEEAIKQLDGKEINGRPLKVNEAKPREDRPRRQRY